VSDNGKNGKDINKENGERRIVRDGGNPTVYRGRSKERASLSFSYDKKPETKAPAARKTEPATRVYDAGQLKAETRVMERKVVADSENKDIVKEMQEAAAREEAASAAKPSVAGAIKDRFNEKKEEIKKARADAAVRKLQRSRAESAARAADEKAAKEKAAKKPAKKTVKYPGKQIKKQTSVQSKKPDRIETAKPKSKKTSGKTSANKAAFKLPVSKPKSKAKKPKKTKRPKTKKQKALAYLLAAVKVLLALVIIGGVTGGAYAAYTIANAPKIHPEKIYDTLEVSTHIYDDQGDLISDIYYDENREIAKYDQLPDNLKNAFIAVEDKTFWEHKGFNFRRIFGAIWDSFTGGGEISGTSTITQQLARNVFLPEEKSIRSIKRKIIEMYYAREIEEVLSKEEILTAYLNTIYLGYGCYGVDTAAKKYFSTNVEDLTLEQSAALAALPQAPGVYALLTTEEGEATTEISDGLYANDISQKRRYMTLDLMAEQGYITAKEAKKAKNFAEADRIRNYLAEKGVTLIDSREGTTYKIEAK
jgi:penicillin-binding protein 1A